VFSIVVCVLIFAENVSGTWNIIRIHLRDCGYPSREAPVCVTRAAAIFPSNVTVICAVRCYFSTVGPLTSPQQQTWPFSIKSSEARVLHITHACQRQSFCLCVQIRKGGPFRCASSVNGIGRQGL
jgi:hypothetical protein